MKIKSIIIHNFRSIKDAKFDKAIRSATSNTPSKFASVLKPLSSKPTASWALGATKLISEWYLDKVAIVFKPFDKAFWLKVESTDEK